MHLKQAHPLVLVLALPRGGVLVGFEVARALSAPLDVVLVRKIGAPNQPEFGLGAIVGGHKPHVLLDDELIALVNPPSTFTDRTYGHRGG
jgi:putative phosphoribosyl transferase